MYKVELTESLFPAQTDTTYRAMTFAKLLAEQAEKRGDAKALRELGETGEIGREWTYAELHNDACRLGRALSSRHERGARIAVMAHNLPEWILLELACGLAGLILLCDHGPRT